MARLKTICKWSPKDIERNIALLGDLVTDPTFFCNKCARCANSKKVLCKPKPLPVKAAWK